MGITYGKLVAANVRAMRARLGVDQGTISRRMQALGYTSWSASKVSACERAARQIDVDELLALAAALECSVADLTGSATAPDVLVAFPAGQEVSGVTVRNSVYGWRDQSVTWDQDDEPRIYRPAEVHSARAWDQASIIAITDPSRLARRAS